MFYMMNLFQQVLLELGSLAHLDQKETQALEEPGVSGKWIVT